MTVDTESSTQCGLGPVKCWQGFANVKVAVLFIGMASFVTRMVANGFNIVGLTSIEKRFSLSGTDIGIIVSAYEIAACICLLPVGYFGRRGSKPRWIGGGVVLMVLGCVLYALPHFFTGLYKATNSDTDAFCHTSLDNVTVIEEKSCDSNDDSSLANYKYIFIIAQLLNGAGFAPLFTIAFIYLDENTHPNNTPLYIAVVLMMTIFGAAGGFVLGGMFIDMHTDFDATDVSNLSIDPDSEAWVGAWWVGPLIGAALAALCVIPIYCLPKRMPGSEKFVDVKNQEVTQPKSDTKTDPQNDDLKSHLKAIGKNTTWVLVVIALCAENFVMLGTASLGLKYFEAQFSVSASQASYLMGTTSIGCAAAGAIFGGLLIKKVQLKLGGILRTNLVLTILSALFYTMFLFQCERVDFAGLSVDYDGRELSSSNIRKNEDLQAACNSNCSCGFDTYDPVCSEDDVTFFNPCAAGCLVEMNGDKYSNCSCASGGHVKRGICNSNCPFWTYLFIVFVGCLVFVQFCSATFAFTTQMRCVEESHRTVALSVSQIAVKVLGTIPGPIAYGALFDHSCLFWLETDCTKDAACYFYDIKNLSFYFVALTMAVKVISVLFYALAVCTYKAPIEDNDNVTIDIKQ